MNITAAKQKLRTIFKKYGVSPIVSKKLKGKTYELFCLAQLIEELSSDGFQPVYQGPKTAKFKSGPGLLDLNDPHFDLYLDNSIVGQIFLNIEFLGLGSEFSMSLDNSAYHELDIVIVLPLPAQQSPFRPSRHQVAFAAECKSTSNFDKSIIKETLGIRRELSLLQEPQSSILSDGSSTRNKQVPADNRSEYRLYYVDSTGQNYETNPRAFGIELVHLLP